MIVENLQKYWKEEAMVLLVFLGFAAGRYTMRSTVEKEAESRYEKQLTQLEERLSNKMKESVETVRKEVQTASEKTRDVDEHIEVDADGKHVIDRKIRSKEQTKTNTIVKTEVKVVEVEKVVERVVVQEKVVEVERKVESVIPPPSWRVYGIAEVRDPADKREAAYGAGTAYSLGPVDVGGFGTYGSQSQSATVGLTVGVSF